MKEFRQVCYRCFKPAVVCVCARIPTVKNNTKILIVQHPDERAHPIGTARFATLGLSNVELKVAYPNDEDQLGVSFASVEGAGLLYPSSKAQDLETLPPSKRPLSLVILDGTWSQANRLYRENDWLHQLPHYRLSPAAPSRYRIRQEPDRFCISSIEAIVAALEILEPEGTDFQRLLSGFDAMIDDQIGYIQSKTGSVRIKRPRKKSKRTIPKVLAEELHNVVVVYGEVLRRENREPLVITWTALRMGTRETFEGFIVLDEELDWSDVDLGATEVADLYRQNAVSKGQFIEEWSNFAKPEDILCSWNKGTLKSFFRFMGDRPPRHIFLKAAYGNTVKEKFGTLDDVMKSHGLHPESTPFVGRAGLRMGNAIAVASYLNEFKR